MVFQEYVFSLGRWRFGWTHDLVHDNQEAYLERWIIWCGITLRLHKFHKGDDDRAFHDHPWWFVTLPMQSYNELTPTGQNHVGAWRPHFRSSRHRHIVQLKQEKPVWTFIITGVKNKDWGFWEDEQFIHNEHWLAGREDPQTERRAPSQLSTSSTTANTAPIERTVASGQTNNPADSTAARRK